ncbi:MAG: hypothetical protein ACK48W_00585 [Bacteroidota bacterium]
MHGSIAHLFFNRVKMDIMNQF